MLMFMACQLKFSKSLHIINRKRLVRRVEVGEVSKVLAQIHQLAQVKGISLVVGEYKLAPDANNLRLMRYEIIFPVQGSYKNLKAFIASASEQFPTLGLTEVNIKRETVKDTAVQIKLSYALMLRREP
jgi:Tfp pilus assembly protein PilO